MINFHGEIVSDYERAKLINADALDAMEKIPKGCIEAIIADPPYMIGAKSAGNMRAKSGGWADMENASLWFKTWLSQAKELLRPTGYACIFTNWRSMPVLQMAFAKSGWEIDSAMIWDKKWIGPAGPKQLRPRYEMILFAGREESKINDRCCPDIIECKWQAGNMNEAGHPAEKPVFLIRKLIKILSLKSDAIILDPFMGSGTSGVAAILEGIKFIGIEREEEYFSMAQRRIHNAIKEPSLFSQAANK